MGTKYVSKAKMLLNLSCDYFLHIFFFLFLNFFFILTLQFFVPSAISRLFSWHRIVCSVIP